MTSLTTTRLRLVPYDVLALKTAINDQPAAARMIGAILVHPSHREHKFMSKIYSSKLEIAYRWPEALLLCTYWQIIPVGDFPVVIGSLGFKGPPVNGAIEIGYGLQPQYRNLGYMSEAVGALCEYAFKQTQFPVYRILASTERGNIASQRVLSKCGFELCETRNGLLSWSLKNRYSEGCNSISY